ncbi:cytochrome ubiquinol oxidase subunit I [Thermofilum pendens]|uniref:Cytochrome bd-type quinol oxidase subunit 1-like protein n=1 Tax=Thermofilum pendens (strain DSM 2475 / Hrk 5) TaxID=368408 RepID=A1S0C2_THEPD|nr:cytochrome ubiquinol oxidase subunit I [Thermofilum pendens]ABL78902.1 Cytochrome bd-type quinol oxidase subunit 1-like protein [Thermofilum pendens Hrk 5]
MNAPVLFMALVFGVHIVAVNIGIALSTIVPLLVKRSRALGDKGLEGVARSLFKVYAATYGLAGVMGTAFTVFLASFYPEFVGVAGNLTMVPFGISIVSIMLHFFAIVAFWYGWDRFSPKVHEAVGWLLAATAYTIPLGFRAVFAFLNTPAGLVLGEKPSLNVVQALLNPTFPPLYLKSVVGALVAGFLFVAAVLAFKGLRTALTDAERGLYVFSLRYASMLLFAMMFLGAWYAVSLVNVPVKFNNIFAPLGASLPAPTTSNYAWLFLVKMVLVAVQGAALLLVLLPRGKGESLLESPAGYKATITAAVAAALTVLTGEYLNAFSQYPFFVANAPLIADKLPEPYRTILTRALNLENVSPLAQDPALYAATVLGVLVLFAAAGYMIYVVFFKKGGEE